MRHCLQPMTSWAHRRLYGRSLSSYWMMVEDALDLVERRGIAGQVTVINIVVIFQFWATISIDTENQFVTFSRFYARSRISNNLLISITFPGGCDEICIPRVNLKWLALSRAAEKVDALLCVATVRSGKWQRVGYLLKLPRFQWKRN